MWKDLKIMLQLSWILPVEIGMTVKRIRVVLVAQRVVHIVENQAKVFPALVGKSNLHHKLERHRNIAVEAFALRTGKKRRLKRRHVCQTMSKEISERYRYRRGRSPIPKHLQLQPAQHGRTPVV